MDEHPHRTLIEALVARVAERTSAETDRLTRSLGNRCWPGGPADRTEPSGREWLRRWRPGRRLPAIVQCSCGQGRCQLCN
jgi:hypothetical protein